MLKEQDFLKLERLAGVKFGKTTGVLCAANSTHHVEINCVGLNFLMKVRLKQLWVETIIKMRQYRVEGRKVLHVGKYYVAEHSKTPDLNKGDKFIIVQHFGQRCFQ